MKKSFLLTLLAFILLTPVFADDSVSGPGGTFVSQILDEDVALTRRSKVNFTGAGISCVDNSAQKRLDCTVTTSGSGGGGSTSLVIRYSGVLVSSPTSTLNFLPPLIVSLDGSTTAQISLSKISLSTGVVGSVDISTQTNLAVASPLILTNDTLSISAISLSTGVVGPLSIASGTITQSYTSTLTFADGTTQNTAAVTSAGDITAVTAGTGMTGGGTAGSVTLNVDSTYSGFIHNTTTLQSDATAYPQFLNVGTSGAVIRGPTNIDGVITASGTVITTTAGLLDATKLTGLVPNASIDSSSVTKMGSAFNGASQLLQLNGSADVPDANLSANVTLLGASIDISAETNLGAIAPLSISGDNVIIDTNSAGGSLILNTNTLQTGATFYVSSGTVQGQFSTHGEVYMGGAAGSDLFGYPIRVQTGFFKVASFGIEGSGVNFTDGSFTFYNNGVDVLDATNGTAIQSNVPWTFSGYDCSGNTNGGKLTTDGSGVVSCADDVSGGSGGSGVSSFTYTFNAAQANLPGANAPYISNSTNAASAGVFFDETSTQTVTWATTLTNYQGGSLRADVVFTSSATSGTMNWGVYIECKTPNVDALSYDTDSFDLINSTSVTVGATSLMAIKATTTLSNGDSCANGDTVRIKLERSAQSSDTAVGKGQVRFLRLYE